MEPVGGVQVVKYATRGSDTPGNIIEGTRWSLTPRKACVIRTVPLASPGLLRKVLEDCRLRGRSLEGTAPGIS